MSSRPGYECSWDRPAAPSEDGAHPPSCEMRRSGGIDDGREGYGFRKKLAGDRRQPAQAGSHGLRWSRHHGYHAGRAPGKAAVGLQRTVRRRPLARQYVAGRERCPAQHVFGLRPRGLVGWSAWRPVLCPPRVLHLACAHDGLCSPGRHPHHARRALWPGAGRLRNLPGGCLSSGQGCCKHVLPSPRGRCRGSGPDLQPDRHCGDLVARGRHGRLALSFHEARSNRPRRFDGRSRPPVRFRAINAGPRRGGAPFLPSFVMMLAVLPVLDHVRKLVWTKAAMRGIGPAVIGMLGVSLVRMAPHALPDVLAAVTLIATVIALMVWRVGTVKAMLLGSLLGVLRSRLSSLRAVKGVLYTFTRALGTAS